MKEMTLGQLGGTLVRYRPFLATVVTAVVVVTLAPGSSDDGNGNDVPGLAPTVRSTPLPNPSPGGDAGDNGVIDSAPLPRLGTTPTPSTPTIGAPSTTDPPASTVPPAPSPPPDDGEGQCDPPPGTPPLPSLGPPVCVPQPTDSTETTQ